MSPTDLVTKWEVYTENRGLDGPPKGKQATSEP